MKVKGKVIVVTGAGSGMGRELALELARRGALVAAVDMRAESLAETAKLVKSLGGKVSTHALDITDTAAVSKLPDAVTKELGAVDGLVNNAGIIQPFVKINDLDISDAERVMNVNF
jgi:NAD(P)-dependent dehydrogenase (short-subunit alcohol dehydrogenase family)